MYLYFFLVHLLLSKYCLRRTCLWHESLLLFSDADILSNLLVDHSFEYLHSKVYEFYSPIVTTLPYIAFLLVHWHHGTFPPLFRDSFLLAYPLKQPSQHTYSFCLRIFHTLYEYCAFLITGRPKTIYFGVYVRSNTDI